MYRLDFTKLPQKLQEQLAKYTVFIVYDTEQERYTAQVCGDELGERMFGAKQKRYKIAMALAVDEFAKALNARQENIKKGVKKPDYSSLDTLDGAWLVASELLWLKIYRLAGKRV